MSKIKISKVTAVPTGASIVEDTIYMVSVSTDIMEVYMSDSTGTTLKRILNESDIQTLINDSLSGISAIQVVSDIASRDALIWSANGKVYVVDATDDTTVNSGGAEYIYDFANSTYIKTSEAESLDLIIQWSNIQGAPTSTPVAIDLAVSNSHTHFNKTELDLLGQDVNGCLTYNGEVVANEYTSVSW